MDRHRNEQFEVAWILSSPAHHKFATSVFDETYHYTLPSASSHVIYTTGRIGEHRVIVASSTLGSASQKADDIVGSLLHQFPAVRAGFLLSTNAETSRKGHAHVGDVVFGTAPDLQSGVLYFDAGETKRSKRLSINYQAERIPETVTSALEAILSYQQEGKWRQYLADSYLRHHQILRGTIATSVERFDDPFTLDRIASKNDILCFETTAASMKSHSFIPVAGIARYSDDRQSSLPSAEICKALMWYLSDLVRLVGPFRLGIEPPLVTYFRYKDFDLDRPGFRLVRLEAGSGREPVRCHLFEAYFDDRETLIPYEALSYCWRSSVSARHRVLVNGGVLFITENLFDALKDLRQPNEDRILWVDAMCINQSNIRERGHQVKWMGKVYKHPERVLFWLGRVPYHFRDLILSLQVLRMEASRQAWVDWTLDDQRWLDVWTRLQTQRLRSSDELDLPTKLKSLMSNKWFSRVWILQELANAQKALLGCSEGWVDAMAFAVAPRFLDVQPNAQCQAVIDIMPGPSRRNSWWSRKPNICTLLWRFRESQASDPRDRLYALLGLSSDMEIGDEKIVADYTKTEDDVLKNIATYLFNGAILNIEVGNLSDLQTGIPDLAAITLERMVLSGCSVDDLNRFVQKQNYTVWLSEAVVEHTRNKSPGRIQLGYFRDNPAFQKVVLGKIPAADSPKDSTTLDLYLKPKPKPATKPSVKTMKELVPNMTAVDFLVLGYAVYYALHLLARRVVERCWGSWTIEPSEHVKEGRVRTKKTRAAKMAIVWPARAFMISVYHFPRFVARIIRYHYRDKQEIIPLGHRKESRVGRHTAGPLKGAINLGTNWLVVGCAIYCFLCLLALRLLARRMQDCLLLWQVIDRWRSIGKVEADREGLGDVRYVNGENVDDITV